MSLVLHNGDYIPDGAGGFVRAEGVRELLQQALFRLGCRKGGFAPMPELGSRLYLLHREKPSARDMAARQYAMEALEGLPVTVEDASVSMDAENVAHVLVTLSAEGETVSVEVTA